MFLDDHCRRKCKNDERKGREERILAIGSIATLGTYLEHFLESILYILYTVSKLGKSEVQYFKRCPNRSWNEKVMVIARKLDRAEREFRTPQSKVRKFSHRAKLLLAHECHFAHRKPILAPCETRCENFAHHYSRCEIHFKVRKSQSKVRILQTSVSHTTIQGVKIFAPCETISWHTGAILHTSSHFSHHAKQGANQGAISHTTIQGAKFIPKCEFECENFMSIGHIFEALPGAQIMHMISRFEAWEVRNPVLQTVSDSDLKWRSYGRLKTTMQSWTKCCSRTKFRYC